jgi:hypothetical protein
MVIGLGDFLSMLDPSIILNHYVSTLTY